MKNSLHYIIAILFLVAFVTTFNYGGCIPVSDSSNSNNSGSSGAPSQVASPNPANGATSVPITQQLSWASASGATSYDVYFGTSSPGTSKGNQTGTTYNPGALANGTLYYWRIDSKNAAGTTTDIVWNFTTVAVSGSSIFNTTGSKTWVVPTGVTSIRVDIRGAKGGGNAGGNGARVQTTLMVTSGQTLYIYIGNQGTNGGSGGYNGGGNGGNAINIDGGGGGGASDIRQGGNGISNRVVIAGGGGGAPGGPNGTGGAGGEYGTQGSGIGGGGGGTQFAGGAGGGNGSPGTIGSGGNGGRNEGGAAYGGGGGGGGYYGGGGGHTTGSVGGGGGGSSYSAGTDTLYTSGYQSGTGWLIITY